MVNKKKYINKAMLKYKAILPIPGKKSLEECFFCLRGEYFFQFRTKDRKTHSMRVASTLPTQGLCFNRELLATAFRAINRPILVRSLFLRKRNPDTKTLLFTAST